MFRIISRMDVKANKLIKSIKLEGLRVVGDPFVKAEEYYQDGIDEIIVNDPVASLYGIENLSKVLSIVTDRVFVPVCAAGGISSVEDVYKMFDQGADKISLNSILFRNKSILRTLVKVFGSQSIVGSIEVKKIEKNKWEAFYHNGRERSHINAFEWIQILHGEGVGELLITSIDSEGMKKGFDLDFLEEFKQDLEIPIILGGGFNTVEHVQDCLIRKSIDGIAIAGLFHYGTTTVAGFKRDLKEKLNVCIR
ncbi:HisA/HisF-related TIM barrel protein [Alphaproteobacteria bacterium]|nr:HisA/HisF-related TIM barrel protein [Alphaproteobacteria bacterium]